jgi:hypothetical protein
MTRPAVTWDRLLAWTRANEIPDGALVHDDEGRKVTGAHYDSPTRRLFLLSGYEGRNKDPVITLERLRETGGQLEVPPEAELWFEGYKIMDDAKVVDLGDLELDGGGHRLFLQRRWG